MKVDAGGAIGRSVERMRSTTDALEKLFVACDTNPRKSMPMPFTLSRG
jgi:hypothetical protein